MDNIHYLNLPHSEALGRTDPFDQWYDSAGPARPETGIFDSLLPIVGDVVALETLDAHPLPDEPFDWSSVEEQDRPFVTEVVELSDKCCDALLDAEYRTIARRILARIAGRDPRCLRRTARAERVAAGLVYLAGRANGEFGRRGRRTAHALWSWWGISSCADRARSLRSAAGLEPERGSWGDVGFDELVLGDAGLLHSSYREQLCRRRDYLKEYAPQPKWRVLSNRRQAEVRAEFVNVVCAGKAVAGTRVVVMLGLGDTLDDASFYALSIPEARDLVRMVQGALDAPAPRVDNSSE